MALTSIVGLAREGGTLTPSTYTPVDLPQIMFALYACMQLYLLM